MKPLEAFLAGAARRRFTWGVSDCSLWVADWIVANGHPDPAAQFRGTYCDEKGCLALLAARGGLEAVFRDGCSGIGLLPLHEPLEGAVGLIGSRPGLQWGAIRQGRVWWVRWGDGLMPFRARARCMWAV